MLCTTLKILNKTKTNMCGKNFNLIIKRLSKAFFYVCRLMCLFRLCGDNCVKRCDGTISCVSNSTCRLGQCVCKPGFVLPTKSSANEPFGSSARCVRDSTCDLRKALTCPDRNSTYQVRLNYKSIRLLNKKHC